MSTSTKKKKLNRWTGFDTVVMILAIFSCIITLYPMVYVLSSSISEPKMVMAGKIWLFPKGVTLDAYKIIMKDAAFLRSFFNSIGYVISGCLLMFLTTVVVAYPLTRPNLKFRKILNIYLVIPMYFGGGMIPTYIVVTKLLGMYNSPLALIIPGCFSIWNMILCRTYMASLSKELIDSAFIDGCDQVRALWKIVLPLCKPVIAVIMIYTIVGIWNSWFNASIYTTNKDIQPVQLHLQRVLVQTNLRMMTDQLNALPMEMQQRYYEMAQAGYQIKYAMIMFTALPILFVYPLFQKHFTKGIMLGSLKG